MIPEKIVVAYKTHFDVGFTDLAKNVIESYHTKMIPKAVELCREAKRTGGHPFVWTMPTWPLLQSLPPKEMPEEVGKDAVQAVEDGNIVWHALPFTTHTEFCGYEDLCHGFQFGWELNRRFGGCAIAAKMTDVPGHTKFLPTLLAHAGVKFLHLGCNPSCMPPDVPLLFFWEGPDGSRVLTMYNNIYGSSLFPPEEWKFPIWLSMKQTNDNEGPPTQEMLNELFAEAAKKAPDTEIVVGKLDDFYRAIEPYLDDSIPVLRGDLADTWIHGVGSYPKEVGKLRQLRGKMENAEKLAALYAPKDREIQEKLGKAYERSLLFGEHTWGMDVKTHLGPNRAYDKAGFTAQRQEPRYKKIESSWTEQSDRITAAEEYTDAALKALPRQEAEGEYTVFNGLGYARKAWVELPEGKKAYDAAGKALMQQGRKALVDLPAMGTAALFLRDEKAAPKAMGKKTVLENQFFRMEADPEKGGICSLFDKRTNKEWADGPLFRYEYRVINWDKVSKFMDKYVSVPSDWVYKDLGRLSYPQNEPERLYQASSCEVVSGDHSLTLISRPAEESIREFGNAAETKVQLEVYDDCPWIDVTVTLHQKQASPYIESGNISLPLKAEKPAYRLNKVGSVIDPAKDIVHNANHAWFCMEDWMDVEEGNQGFAVVPLDAPLVSIGEDGTYLFKPYWEEKDPTLYLNLFNNEWGTNFPQWMEGDFTFRYRIIPHAGDWKQIAKTAYETNHAPLLVPGRLPEKKGIRAEGAEISCLKTAWDQKGLVVRIRTVEDQKQEAVLHLPVPCKATPCDLLERPIGETVVTDTIQIELPPFGMASFRLEEA